MYIREKKVLFNNDDPPKVRKIQIVDNLFCLSYLPLFSSP